MDMHTKLPSKMAKNCCCHSDSKFDYLCSYLSAGPVKPFNDIGRTLIIQLVLI